MGSSPLTRGKREQGTGNREPPPRLIPAHAGKTHSSLSEHTQHQAHPRSRGENLGRVGSDRGDGGSSPLTRGKPARRPRWGARRRLIPAHAGKTWGCAGRDVRRAAHPRSRGENPAMAAKIGSYDGSSPLTRGKPRVGRRGCPRVRLIPAHAGKTCFRRRFDRSCQAHPRSRGENPLPGLVGGFLVGSSPLTRGKRRGYVDAGVDLGLIPAHAGKTS